MTDEPSLGGSSADSPFDPGLQPERTLLAWQRTLLATGVACALALRFTALHFGALAIVAGVTGLGLVLAGYFGARYRYRRAHKALHRNASLQELSAWPLAALAASTLMLGLMSGLFVMSGLHF